MYPVLRQQSLSGGSPANPGQESTPEGGRAGHANALRLFMNIHRNLLAHILLPLTEMYNKRHRHTSPPVSDEPSSLDLVDPDHK